jgi:hypothetical protein
MPKSHQKYLEWTPSRIIAWAGKNGPHTETLISRIIESRRHPFEMRYDKIENVDWESCSLVLDSAIQLEALREGW